MPIPFTSDDVVRFYRENPEVKPITGGFRSKDGCCPFASQIVSRIGINRLNELMSDPDNNYYTILGGLTSTDVSEREMWSFVHGVDGLSSYLDIKEIYGFGLECRRRLEEEGLLEKGED